MWLGDSLSGQKGSHGADAQNRLSRPFYRSPHRLPPDDGGGGGGGGRCHHHRHQRAAVTPHPVTPVTLHENTREPRTTCFGVAAQRGRLFCINGTVGWSIVERSEVVGGLEVSKRFWLSIITLLLKQSSDRLIRLRVVKVFNISKPGTRRQDYII